MTGLLMTRPREASERFVAALPAAVRDALTICHSPLLDIVPVAGQIAPGGARGLIFTSVNGVATAAALTARRDLPCFCVGQATAAAARAAGWRAECAGDTADALVAALSGRPTLAPLLHLRGVHARGDIAARLSRAGCPTTEVAIYDQVLRPLSAEALRLLDGPAPVIVPLFSPRTARQFADCVKGAAPRLLVALSPAVARPLLSLPHKELRVADRPDAGAVALAVAALAAPSGRVEGDGPAQ